MIVANTATPFRNSGDEAIIYLAAAVINSR